MIFFKDLKKYFHYCWYSAICELKGQVVNSYLGWLWWILDPLLYMLIYSFVVICVFGNHIENFPIFVFIGLTVWNFFGTTVQSSIGIIRSYAAVSKKVYIPKFVFVLMTEIVNFIKMMIGLAVIAVALMVFKIQINFTIFNLIPIIIVYFLFTFGVSLLCAHIGLFVADLSNIMNVGIRFLFYLSGVFYSLSNLSESILAIYNLVCPTGFIITQFRNAILYGYHADFFRLFYWLIFAIIFIFIGLKLIYRHEKDYIKIL